MDDQVLAKKARLIALQDFWLVENGKTYAVTKVCLKKAANAKKKAQDKLDHLKEKV